MNRTANDRPKGRLSIGVTGNSFCCLKNFLKATIILNSVANAGVQQLLIINEVFEAERVALDRQCGMGSKNVYSESV